MQVHEQRLRCLWGRQPKNQQSLYRMVLLPLILNLDSLLEQGPASRLNPPSKGLPYLPLFLFFDHYLFRCSNFCCNVFLASLRCHLEVPSLIPRRSPISRWLYPSTAYKMNTACVAGGRRLIIFMISSEPICCKMVLLTSGS